MEIVLNLWVLLKVTAGISLDKDYTRVFEFFRGVYFLVIKGQNFRFLSYGPHMPFSG